MMWIEILSRQREVAARVRIAASEVRIGRGYDNDVVIDDPYVAAQHLRVVRRDDGSLFAEDVGSANGTFIDGSKTRLSDFVVDGKQPIRIGQTYLRIRDVDHEVERELIAPPERHVLPIILALVIGVLILAIDALKIWLTQTSEPRASAYFTPLLTVAGTLLVWVGLWALLCRIFTGRSHFLRNLLIVLIGLAAFSLCNEFAQYAAFAWTWPWGVSYEYVAGWLIFAIVCFGHLREIGRSRLWLKGGLVAALLAGGIGVQTLQQSEAFTDSGRQRTVHWLMPPMLRAVPVSSEDAFFDKIGSLKGELDTDRSQARPGEPRL
ncbi:FHA domain-containing protein [Bradyrhizobium manausense]|uniref:FHA domain-containing protein n=1 Tax=Bradyrhizobium manausense TaxID=989370 RepID=UPI001BAACBE6|nr:FHA domain-containing protein [Bradyrhizobium manausense]MBR0688465.1 FHA domain-containing protein [Bradyrhizobium manausense]MBR0720877.1 FHA domain-containing protein [Bradyrhizobium manausense]MBR0833802.1 FHA domain-containing protein [Bradyrhizobium manausense]